MSHMNAHSSVNNRHPVFSINHSIMIAHSFISFLIFNYLNMHSGHLLSFGLCNTHLLSLSSSILISFCGLTSSLGDSLGESDNSKGLVFYLVRDMEPS